MGLFDDVAKLGKDIGKATFDAAIAGKESFNEKQKQNRIEYMNKEAERMAYEAQLTKIAKNVIATTGDLKQDYEIIRPIFFQVTNMGTFKSKFDELEEKYKNEIEHIEKDETSMIGDLVRDFFHGMGSPGEGDFERAFYIAVEELKRKAILLGGNAVINIVEDIDFGGESFFLQMYGTAVKIKQYEEDI